MSDIKGTRIHLNLNSLFVIKNNLNKLCYGLFKYAQEKKLYPPYIFTAEIQTNDNGYLGTLKNNCIRLVESIDTNRINAHILFDSTWKLEMPKLLAINNLPIFSKIQPSRVCVYIDWDNIQVSSENIKPFIDGVCIFIDKIKVHVNYQLFVFLHNKISENIKQLLKKHNVNIILIIKDKSGCGDEEMFRFIRRNTIPGDSICIASGDRDFSSLMIEYVRNSYNVFLVYNKQALYTFKHNIHWLGSIDVHSINGIIVRKSNVDQKTVPNKNKPCKFYNMGICNSIVCSFLHICGTCGRHHKMQDFHPKITYLKTTICKKYNYEMCPYNKINCQYLHICTKCKNPHPYTKCQFIILHCPICKINIQTPQEFIKHEISDMHFSESKNLRY
jgi:hypothetical protein